MIVIIIHAKKGHDKRIKKWEQITLLILLSPCATTDSGEIKS